jgi:hypothetical protein
MNKLRFLMYALTIFILIGCSSDPEPVVRVPNITTEVYASAPVSGTHIAYQNLNTLRSPENVKAYHIGRYEDPFNKNIMYEATVAYELTDEAKWVKDYNPNRPPFAGQLGYQKHYDRDSEILTDEYLAKNLEMRQSYNKYLATLKSLKSKHATIDKVVDTLKQTTSKNTELSEQLLVAKKRELVLRNQMKTLQFQIETLLKRAQEDANPRSKYDRN